jgi:hypothetical protein
MILRNTLETLGAKRGLKGFPDVYYVADSLVVRRWSSRKAFLSISFPRYWYEEVHDITWFQAFSGTGAPTIAKRACEW